MPIKENGSTITGLMVPGKSEKEKSRLGNPQTARWIAEDRENVPPTLQGVYFGAARFAIDSKTLERVSPLTYPELQGIPHLEAARSRL
jgi:hypothetical protein